MAWTIKPQNLTANKNPNMSWRFQYCVFKNFADKKSKNNITRSLSNIPNVKITDINHFSAYDLAKYKKIIFTETSIKESESKY
mgnify:CR=1 FL=1